MASLVIACASDVRYALPLAVMLRSVLENLGPAHHVEVYAVDDGISPADKARVLASLTDQVTIHWVEPNRVVVIGSSHLGPMPVTTYQKLTLGEWLPANIEKVLWLDCDLLVLDDIVPLWDIDLGQWHALAVPDQRVPMVSSRFGVAAYRELQLPADARYFNAGVLLIDLARWRKDDVAGRSMDYLNKYRDRVFFWDQEALNAVLAGKLGELDDGWNQNPTIEHFLPPRALTKLYNGRPKSALPTTAATRNHGTAGARLDIMIFTSNILIGPRGEVGGRPGR